tara:strand:+ start:364 stop:927 length:564 start_codon:yes stop_codon:yes gene_type:complete
MKRIKSTHPDALKCFLNALNANQIVAYPTDTIYGLGTDVQNIKGINKINKIKKRNQPMSIILSEFNFIKKKLLLEKAIAKKIENILEDGSTCIAKYKPGSFNEVISHNGKIGFRIPNHIFLKSVLRLYNKPITTTSVNKTGQNPLNCPDKIEEIFGNTIDLLIDEGEIKNIPSKIYMIEMNEITRIR